MTIKKFEINDYKINKGLGKPYSQQPGRQHGKGTGRIGNAEIDLPGEVHGEEEMKEQDEISRKMARDNALENMVSEAYGDMLKERIGVRFKEMTFDPGTFRNVANYYLHYADDPKGLVNMMGNKESLYNWSVEMGWIPEKLSYDKFPTDMWYQEFEKWVDEAKDDDIKSFQDWVFKGKQTKQGASEGKTIQQAIDEIGLEDGMTYQVFAKRAKDKGYNDEEIDAIYDHLTDKKSGAPNQKW